MKKLANIITIVWFAVILGMLGFTLHASSIKQQQQNPVDNSYYAHMINRLFEFVEDSDILSEELRAANPEIAKCLLDEHNDCVSCKALALLSIREFDGNWADTLGEFSEADELDEACINVLTEHELNQY
jgi:hypothetical protein